MPRVFLALAILSACAAATGDPSASDDGVPSLDAAPADSPTTAATHAWWNLWPRPTNAAGTSLADTLAKMQSLDANMLNAGTAPTDPGYGPYFQVRYSTATVDGLHAQGMHVTGYIEGVGQSYEPIIAIHKLGDGTYEWDAATDSARTEATLWNWEQYGVGSPNTNANTKVWGGMASFLSNQSWWLGTANTAQAMGLAASYPSATLPTTDGASAAGYVANAQFCPASDPYNPRCSRAYDALYSRGIDGIDHDAGAIVGPLDTETFDRGQLLFQAPGKDVASPFWLAYQTKTIQWAVAHNTDGFWMDNTSGWDFVSSVPNRVAFGRWSIAKFRDYVNARPSLRSLCPTPCDIRAYLQARIQSWYSDGAAAVASPFDSRYAPQWKDPRFVADPIWRAFLAFKGDAAHAYSAGVRAALKAAATAAGHDPAQYYLGGNDVPGLSLGALDGDELDQVSTEYGPGTTTSFALDTDRWPRGYPPSGSTAPVEATAIGLENSQHAILWYYLPSVDAGKPNLSKLLGFEALANNSLLTQTGPTTQLDPPSLLAVNTAIERLAPTLGVRRRAGAVALVYGSYTQAMTITPGGFLGVDSCTAGSTTTSHLDATVGLAGWAEALAEYHTPYRVLADYKLPSGIPDDVSVLVFPHIRTIDPNTISLVLQPFLARGGVIVVTGTDSGMFNTRHNSYVQNTGALLYTLTQSNPAHAKLMAGNPGFDFFVGKRRTDVTPGCTGTAAAQLAAGRNAIRSQIDALRQAGVLATEVSLPSWGTNVWVTTYASEDGARIFYDLLNASYTYATDALPPAQGGAATLAVPSTLASTYVFSHWHDASGAAVVDHHAPRTAGTVRVSVPAFANYGTLVLDNTPGPGVSVVAAGRGCADLFCLWIQGFNLSTSTQVVVRDHAWNPFHTYAGAELVYALAGSPQQVNLRLATAAERNELVSHGLILTVVDHGTWDNISVPP